MQGCMWLRTSALSNAASMLVCVNRFVAKHTTESGVARSVRWTMRYVYACIGDLTAGRVTLYRDLHHAQADVIISPGRIDKQQDRHATVTPLKRPKTSTRNVHHQMCINFYLTFQHSYNSSLSWRTST